MIRRRPAVSLHIERLVLHGLPLTATQGARMQASLQRELARLVAERGGATEWAGRGASEVAGPAVAPNRSPSVVWDAARPVHLGRALARSVFGSLNLSAPPAARSRGRA